MEENEKVLNGLENHRIFIFDTETTGLIKKKKSTIDNINSYFGWRNLRLLYIIRLSRFFL